MPDVLIPMARIRPQEFGIYWRVQRSRGRLSDMEPAPANAENSAPQPSLPAARPRRRWLRYSLRALLALTTLMCLALGWFVNKCERQRRAVAAIEELGGSVEFEEREGEPGALEAWLRERLPRSYFDDVDAVTLSDDQLTDSDLACVEDLSSLHELAMFSPQITDAGLQHIAGLTALQELDLSGTQITDVGLQHLPNLTSVQRLDLSETKMTEAGLQHLARLTALESLS